MMLEFLKTILAVFLAFGACLAHAQVDADPLPGDPKLVVFAYDENNSFRVFTKPLASTHIQLDNDERIKILTLGDTASWMTAQRDNNLFIKPRYPNISTSGTLITTKRTYQFVFWSTTENGRWYQRVSFQNPNDMMIETTDADRRQLSVAVKDQANPPPGAAEVAQSVAPESLNFNYEVTGEANIKPTNIFDDGASTYIRIRNAEDVPAVFRLVDNEVELIDYVLKGNTIVIAKVIDAGLLKLGNQEVRFYNLNRVSKKMFGGYRVEGSGKCCLLYTSPSPRDG